MNNKQKQKGKIADLGWKIIVSAVEVVPLILFLCFHWELPISVMFQSTYVDLYIGQLSIAFIVVSVIGVLSSKNENLYWEDLIQYSLVNPIGSSIQSLAFYLFMTVLCSTIALCTQRNTLFLIYFACVIVIMIWIVYKIMSVYFYRNFNKKQLQKRYKKNPSLRKTYMDGLLEKTTYAIEHGQSAIIKENIDFLQGQMAVAENEEKQSLKNLLHCILIMLANNNVALFHSIYIEGNRFDTILSVSETDELETRVFQIANKQGLNYLVRDYPLPFDDFLQLNDHKQKEAISMLVRYPLTFLADLQGKLNDFYCANKRLCHEITEDYLSGCDIEGTDEAIQERLRSDLLDFKGSFIEYVKYYILDVLPRIVEEYPSRKKYLDLVDIIDTAANNRVHLYANYIEMMTTIPTNQVERHQFDSFYDVLKDSLTPLNTALEQFYVFPEDDYEGKDKIVIAHFNKCLKAYLCFKLKFGPIICCECGRKFNIWRTSVLRSLRKTDPGYLLPSFYDLYDPWGWIIYDTMLKEE